MFNPKDFIRSEVDNTGGITIFSTFPTDKEVWFDIPDYEGVYQCSNLGGIKSLDRIIDNGRGGTRFAKGRILKGGIGCAGYPVVVLAKDSSSTTKSIHQLIAIVFLGHNPDGTNRITVDHKLGGRVNNRVDNLQLITNRQNTVKGRRTKGGTSDYVGVYWKSGKNRFYCQISLLGIEVHLGTSEVDKELSHLYRKALKKFYQMKLIIKKKFITCLRLKKEVIS